MSYIASNDLVRIIKYAVYHFEEIKNISLITDDRGNRNNYSLFYKKIQDILNGYNFQSNKKFFLMFLHKISIYAVVNFCLH